MATGRTPASLSQRLTVERLASSRCASDFRLIHRPARSPSSPEPSIRHFIRHRAPSAVHGQLPRRPIYQRPLLAVGSGREFELSRQHLLGSAPVVLPHPEWRMTPRPPVAALTAPLH